MLHSVHHEPEIPQNTGNIARTCAATGAKLHIIKPIPFEISDRTVKRAGLDYWHLVDITIYENLQEFYDKNPGAVIWMASTIRWLLCFMKLSDSLICSCKLINNHSHSGWFFIFQAYP